jgi:hypothetical protein
LTEYGGICHLTSPILVSDTEVFNKMIFQLLKDTDYPIGKLDSFALIENEEVLKIDDVFERLRSSGVGVLAYYEPLEYELEVLEK